MDVRLSPDRQQNPAPTAGERPSAPAYVIDLIMRIMRQAPPPAGPPPGTVDYARAAHAQARGHADQIWAEAWTAGATWGLAHNAQPLRFLVAAERLEELREDTA